MIWPMMALGMSASFYQRSLASSARLKEIFNEKTNIVPNPESKTPVVDKAGKIEIRNLSFSFPGSSDPVLKNISLTIEAGTRVAFVGKIGSGKSALFSILPRIYPAPPQTVFFDGVAIEEWPIEELRARIGFVGQDVFLFSESVFENIGFGIQNKTDDERRSIVKKSAELAGVDQDIRGLPKGYETLLGERGVNLSGGQKQRVSLARAIAIEPEILILDDALSAVDVKTEKEILGRLKNRPNRNTELIGAHRISTVREADRIFVLEKGEIAEEG
jgi:ATP-binding cassette subfamily B protein